MYVLVSLRVVGSWADCWMFWLMGFDHRGVRVIVTVVARRSAGSWRRRAHRLRCCQRPRGAGCAARCTVGGCGSRRGGCWLFDCFEILAETSCGHMGSHAPGGGAPVACAAASGRGCGLYCALCNTGEGRNRGWDHGGPTAAFHELSPISAHLRRCNGVALLVLCTSAAATPSLP